ncbi:hypothetical protein E8E14_013904 [Neopestalotiopsis sp. 37M]|nr:hypothetical protein E8E14_013904 [Neopestalotiopsis sp. 37M]
MASDDEPDSMMDIARSECAFLTQPHATIIDIDKRGDLILLVGKRRCEIKANGDHKHTEAMAFRVCSRALARSSPVMEAMLFGSFREAAQKTINLPEDDPEAVQSLLYLAHGDVEKIFGLTDREASRPACPQAKFVDYVYALAVVANKYLMTQKLRPFMSTWCQLLITWEEVESHSSSPETYERLEKLMWIAHEFGHLELYQTVFMHLTWYLEHGHVLFCHVLEPDGATDHIRLGRMKDINGALIPARNAIHALIADVDPTGLYLCNQPAQEDRLRCQSHTLGHMIRKLNEASLWPLPDAEDIAQTAQTFVVDFQQQLWSNYTPLHENCTIERAVIAQIENAADTSRRYHSIPSKPVLRCMLATAKRFNAFEYHRMYLDANVKEKEVYD